ncbi:hypothetical protein G7Y79_00068g096150 [Physcia stellaris]|nr:hypothetical protein G7Y79_00068g096150 [Physcia stellaris]
MEPASTDSLHNGDVFELHQSGVSASLEPKLPPQDGGKDAWLFLCACFSVEALVWGFPFSFGVFQQYYSTHEPFQSDGSGIAIIGTLAAGLMYFLSPFVLETCRRFPHRRRLLTIIGLAFLPLTLVASSYAQRVWQLILTQGVLYAIGGCMIYMPTLQYLDEWFVKRKGFALGVTFAGTGIGGLVIPLIMNWALQTYSARTALQIWAVSLVVFTAPLVYYMKPRIPKAARRQPIHLGFLKQPIFWFMETGNIIQGVGYFIPTIFLPTFADKIGLSELAGSSTLSLLNAATTIGGIIIGAASDKYDVTNVIIVSTISIFLIWGFSSSIAPLYVFSILYGLFGGGFSSCWAAIVREVRSRDPRAEQTVVFGLLAAGRGIGCVVCGPLSNELLKGGKGWDAAAAYGTGYGLLIVFTGVTAMLGSGQGAEILLMYLEVLMKAEPIDMRSNIEF